MKKLYEIKALILENNLSCPNCDFCPDDHPSNVFQIIGDTSRKTSFPKRKCPECQNQFNAIICECGRGYRARQDFDVVSKNDSTEKYKCSGCRNILHINQRI